MKSIWLLHAAWTLALFSCASPEAQRQRSNTELESASAALAEPARSATAIGSLERFLAETEKDPTLVNPRFAAALLLTELHARAAVQGPFRRDDAAHWVAALNYASRAQSLVRLALYEPVDATAGLPAALAAVEPRLLEAKLAFFTALAYSRLAFPDEAAITLVEFDELRDPPRALELFERLQLAPELRPWACAMASDHLRKTNELAAYRFAILALEGGERFGHALSPDETARLEDWILKGSSAAFVCPESGTPYVPGRRTSPISGIAHYEYVAVPRTRPR